MSFLQIVKFSFQAVKVQLFYHTAKLFINFFIFLSKISSIEKVITFPFNGVSHRTSAPHFHFEHFLYFFRIFCSFWCYFCLFSRYTRLPTRYICVPTRYTRVPTRYICVPPRYSCVPTRYSCVPTRYSCVPTRYSRMFSQYFCVFWWYFCLKKSFLCFLGQFAILEIRKHAYNYEERYRRIHPRRYRNRVARSV